MTQLLDKFSGGELLGLAAIVGGLLCGITAIIAGAWQKARRAEVAAALKHDMLNRGTSAEDIRTVLDAGSKGSRKAFHGRGACEV
jgi:uncharacterized membrane protein